MLSTSTFLAISQIHVHKVASFNIRSEVLGRQTSFVRFFRSRNGCPGMIIIIMCIMLEPIRETSFYTSRQKLLVHSRLSSLSHCGLIFVLKEWNWSARKKDRKKKKKKQQQQQPKKKMKKKKAHAENVLSNCSPESSPAKENHTISKFQGQQVGQL